MREVTAYLCEKTERIHGTVAAARRSEFQALIKYAAGMLPAGAPSNTMQDAIAQLGRMLEPPVFINREFLPRLRAALDYLEAHIAEM